MIEFGFVWILSLNFNMSAPQSHGPDAVGLQEKSEKTAEPVVQPDAHEHDVPPVLELALADGGSIDPELARRVLRKIDWFLMPAMVVGNGICLPLAWSDEPFENYGYADRRRRLWSRIL